LPDHIGPNPCPHTLSLSTMTSSTILNIDSLSTLHEQVPGLLTNVGAFQLTISSECGKKLSLLSIPPDLVNDPERFYSWIASRSFVDQGNLPPQTAATDVTVTVVGVFGDYGTYDKVGKAVTKLAKYQDLYLCLDKAKDKWSKSSVFIRPRQGLTAEKQPRKRIERKRQPRRHGRTQQCNHGPPTIPPRSPPRPVPPAFTTIEVPSPHPSAETSCPVSNESSSANELSTPSVPSLRSLPNSIPSHNLPMDPANPFQFTDPIRRTPEHPSPQCHVIATPRSKIPRVMILRKRSRRESPGCIPKRRRLHSPKGVDCFIGIAGPSRIPVRTPATTRNTPGPVAFRQLSPPTPSQSPLPSSMIDIGGRRSPSRIPVRTPTARNTPVALAQLSPPTPSPRPSLLPPSSPLPRPLPAQSADLPFRLADISEHYHHLFEEDGIPRKFYELFPREFPYGTPATNISWFQGMSIFLMSRQTGRLRVLSCFLEIHPTESEEIWSLSFMGTTINGVTLRVIPYQEPKSTSHKICLFGCRDENISNKPAALRHHRPRQMNEPLSKCRRFPGVLLCPSAREFRRKRDLLGDGGLEICFHEYEGQGTVHWKTQLLQVGQALLEFASRHLRMSGDTSVEAWNKSESGCFN